MSSTTLPPGVSQFIDAISQTLTVMTVCAVWLGVSIPLFVILFYFTPSAMRRKPIFVVNAIALAIGIAIGVMNIAILMKSVVDPIYGIDRPASLAYTAILSSIDIFIDSILLFRVIAVFPPSQTPTPLLCGIFGPLFLLKIGRLVNFVVFMVQFNAKTRNIRASPLLYRLSELLPEPKIGWGLQLLDNFLCSAIFLWRLNEVRSLALVVRGGNGKASYPTRLMTLFWIAVSNFVFPVVFIIVQLILIFRDSNNSDVLVTLISNIYVEIIGVLFATIWAMTTRSDSGASTTIYSIHFASVHPPHSTGINQELDSTNASAIPGPAGGEDEIALNELKKVQNV